MRLLHTMLRVGNLDRSIDFYTNILGMKLLRKKEYPEGEFTNAFIGYGDESNHTVLELTYNWDTDHYDLGEGFGHIAIEVDDVYKACEEIPSKGGKLTYLDQLQKQTSTIDPALNQRILTFLTQNGETLIATNGKGVVVGSDPTQLLKNAEERFRKVPFGISVPQKGEISRTDFDSNLIKQYQGNSIAIERANEAIWKSKETLGERPLRQVVFETKIASPKSTSSHVSISTKQQQILLYEGANRANQYIQIEANSGATLVTVGKSKLFGNENLYSIGQTKNSLTGQGIQVRTGFGGQYSEIFKSEDPKLNGREAKISFAGFTELSEGTLSLVIQSQVMVESQLFNIETKISPSLSIPKLIGSKTLDDLNRELLEKTIKTLDDISKGKPVMADAVISSQLISDLVSSSLEGVPGDVAKSIQESLDQFLSDIINSGKLQDVSLQKKVGG